MRVLYLYAGSRKAFYEKWRQGLVPDTQLLGLNYMEKLGVDAEFIEWRLPELLRRVSFNLVHLPYLFAIKKYDVVFLCAGLPLVFLAKKILRWKSPKFVIYNTYLANALKRHPRGILHWLNKKAIEGLDVIVCTARAQIQPLIDAGIAPEKITFRTIGIDAKRLATTARLPMLGASNIGSRGEPFILSVGRDLGRDYKTLFDAVRGLDVKVIVATKPEAIAGLSIPPNVEIRFHVPYEEMPALYQNALFVVTSLKSTDNHEGSETSGQYGYLEPMAAGIAVIATDKPVVRDYIEHDNTGILIPPENASALRAAIEKLLADESLRTRLGQIAQQKVLAEFTSEHWARSLAEIFKSLE
ncbi:MAG: glycosyltransferase family 4 protein [bacterium]|nr:glycosyltransferase family 4 protein [bacterium]